MSQGRNLIGSLLKWANASLVSVSDAPELDAEWLMLKALNIHETSWLHAHEEEVLSCRQKQIFEELVGRRSTGEPLAYILSEWEFYGRMFYVNKYVLVPRPITELLVDEALKRVKLMAENERKKTFSIADIGTGSGCIIVTLVLELTKRQSVASKFRFLATDISPTALAVARRNAERHGVADKIEFRQGDMLEPLRGESIDLIVSNPPYIKSSELSQPSGNDVERAGLNFEPRSALDGGVDGQEYINKIKTAGIPAVIEGTGGVILFLGG